MTAEFEFQIQASNAKYEYEDQLIKNLSANKNYNIYKYISFLTKHSTLPTTMYYAAEQGDSDYEKAHLFNQYFYSVFTTDSSDSFPTTSCASHSNILEKISISSQEVYNVLVSLDPSKAQGIDHLSPKIWKISAPYFLPDVWQMPPFPLTGSSIVSFLYTRVVAEIWCQIIDLSLYYV